MVPKPRKRYSRVHPRNEVASLGIKLPRNQTTNRQHSVSPQFHHAAHGYTLSKEGEGPLVRVQRGSIGPVLRLPVEVEWGGWSGDEAVYTYDPDMFRDESGVRLPWTVSPFEMGLEPSEIWRLIEYYKVSCSSSALEGASASQRMYEALRDTILERAVVALEQKERQRAQHAKKTASAAYWIKYFEKAEAEKEEALAAVRRGVTGEAAST